MLNAFSLHYSSEPTCILGKHWEGINLLGYSAMTCAILRSWMKINTTTEGAEEKVFLQIVPNESQTLQISLSSVLAHLSLITSKKEMESDTLRTRFLLTRAAGFWHWTSFKRKSSKKMHQRTEHPTQALSTDLRIPSSAMPCNAWDPFIICIISKHRFQEVACLKKISLDPIHWKC